MCLMCEEEAFYQAYMAYKARKEAGLVEPSDSPFKAEAVDDDAGKASAAAPGANDKATPS